MIGWLKKNAVFAGSGGGGDGGGYYYRRFACPSLSCANLVDTCTKIDNEKKEIQSIWWY